jgi:phosphohistidine phosphatase
MSERAQETLRTLVVVRHASAAQVAASDHERPLTAEGAGAARRTGAWLTRRGVAPAHALVSGARRTLDTWHRLREGAGWAFEAEVSEPLYSAGIEVALDLLHELPEHATTAVLVGHNPTVAMLAHLLDDGAGDADAVIALTTGGFPPCSAAVFSFRGTWWDLGAGRAELRAYRAGQG